jgi:hypothetical protein
MGCVRFGVMAVKSELRAAPRLVRHQVAGRRLPE